MLATSFVAIGCTEAAGVDAIESDDTVTLDVTKTYTENKTELAKLGVSGYDCWEYNDEYGSYVLTLDNVNFKTTASVGLKLTAPSNVENPKIVIKLVGENTITSGSVIKSETSMEDLKAKAIFATHVVDGAEKCDFNVAFIGDGSMAAVNVNNNKSIIGSSGIDVYGSLYVVNGAKVMGYAGEIYHLTHAPEGEIEDDLNIFSVGIYVTHYIVVREQSLLYGVGSNVTVLFTNEAYEGPHDIYSEGMSAESYTIRDSTVHGVGGEVYFGVGGTTEAPGTFELYSVSAGISARDTAIGEKEMHVKISNSKVIGIGHWSKGRDTSESVGIELAASDRITIEDSVIYGSASGAECASVSVSGVARTNGIDLTGVTDITSSLVQGVSGDVAIAPGDTPTHLYGLLCDSDMTVRDSIIIGRGYGLEDATYETQWSDGIALGRMDGDALTSYTLTVIDSEVYAKGELMAIYATEVKADTGYRECCAVIDGECKTIPVYDLAMKYKSVHLLYGYDIIIVGGVTGIVAGFDRCDGNMYVVEPFHGYVPDGMKFAGYVDADGNEVKVGSTIQIDDYAVLYTTYKENDESSGGSSWVVWVVVIVAVIAIALLVAAAYAWKSR